MFDLYSFQLSNYLTDANDACSPEYIHSENGKSRLHCQLSSTNFKVNRTSSHVSSINIFCVT